MLVDEPLIKIYPGLAAACLKKNAGGFALWSLARSLDKPGRGCLPLSDLKEFAAQCGLERYRWKRAYSQAQKLRLLLPSKNPKGIVSITGLEQAALNLGVYYVGAQPVLIPASSVTSIFKLRSAFWCAIQTGRKIKRPHVEDSPISRKALRENSSVAERSQRRYEASYRQDHRDFAIKSTPNIELIGDNPSRLAGEWEFGDRRNIFSVGGHIYRRMPNTYTSYLKRCKCGLARKVNRALLNQLATEKGRFNFRMYHRSIESANKAVKKKVKASRRTSDNREVRVLCETNQPLPFKALPFKADVWVEIN